MEYTKFYQIIGEALFHDFDKDVDSDWADDASVVYVILPPEKYSSKLRYLRFDPDDNFPIKLLSPESREKALFIITFKYTGCTQDVEIGLDCDAFYKEYSEEKQ